MVVVVVSNTVNVMNVIHRKHKLSHRRRTKTHEYFLSVFVCLKDPPFVMRNNEGKLEGYSIDLIDYIAKMLNFRYDIYLAPDGLYGGKAVGGGYNGLVGQLTKGVRNNRYCERHRAVFACTYITFR